MKKLLFLFAILMLIAVGSCSSEHDVAITGIRLDKTTLTLQKGEQGKLVASVTPEDVTNPEIVWKSSDPSIVAVDMNGSINAVAAGTANIIASTKDGKISASCLVSVKVNVSSIQLQQNTVTLEKGTSIRLIAEVKPNDATDKKLNWKSDNPNIAEVDEDGNITAINGGNTIITVMSGDGKITETCFVSVVVPVQEVILSQTEIVLIKGQSALLNVVVNPLDATTKDVLWSTNDNEVASVDEGVIKAVGIGTATITVVSLDGNKVATCLVKVENSENITYNPYEESEQW